MSSDKESTHFETITHNNVVYRLVKISIWNRYYRTDNNDFYTVSRLLDGSFNEANFALIDPDTLSSKEQNEASVAMMVSGRTDLPIKWQRLIAEFKSKYQCD